MAVVTNEFLDFTAPKGNDMRQTGLTDECKWCLCVFRWREAMLAGKGINDKMIPK